MRGNKLFKNSGLTLVILGPAGSGKGTQSALLARRFNLKIIEMGAELRALALKNTPLGRKIDYLINKKGQLVSNKIIKEVLRQCLKKSSREQNIIFDGVPRTIGQAKIFSSEIKKAGRSVDYLIYLDLKKEETIKRLNKRRMCASCKTIYINGVDIKKDAKVCPKCKGNIIKRQDDKPEAIRKRICLFKKETKPVIDYYKKNKEVKFIKVNASQPINKVYQDIVSNLEI